MKKNVCCKQVILSIYDAIKLKDFNKGMNLIIDNFESLQCKADFHFSCGVFFTEAINYDLNKYGKYYNNIELAYLNALELGESNDDNYGFGSYHAAYNLGVHYEKYNDIQKAKSYYSIADRFDYEPARKRLNRLNLAIALNLK